MPARYAHGPSSVWPDAAQELLLTAACMHGQEAIEAWRSWADRTDIDRADPGSRRLFALAYRNLSALHVDDERLAPLHQAYRSTWLRNQHLLRTLRRLTSVLDAVGVPTIVVKGAALGPLYYGDEGVRVMGDVDVLVPESVFVRAIEVLQHAGWHSSYPRLSCFDSRFGHAVDLFEHDQAAGVDLHCHLLMACCEPGADEAFWEGAVTVELAGMRTRTLTPTDHLLHACVHGLEWVEPPSVTWVADILAIVDRADTLIDWDRLKAVAAARRVTLATHAALHYVRRRFHARIPEHALADLRSVPVSSRDRRRFELHSANREGRPLLELGYHWNRIVRGVGADTDVLALRALAAVPAYLRCWIATGTAGIPAVLALKAARMVAYRLGMYRYPQP